MTRLSVIPLILSLAIQAAANDDLTDPTFSDLEEDTAQIADTIGSTEVLPDSLKVPDTSAASVQNRYELFKQSRRPLPAVSYADSLAVYLLTERLNRRRQIDQSFYHDAGDYFRFTPSFFILEHQVTPLRKTVQPFGLTGDRLNFLIQRNNARPFEHIPEPDGLTDLNDLPTALDHDVYV
ncbi:MAG TPA: hypothetical protein VN285_01875, partial [Candidatus Deferrimicrobium sp.]|nr:hypothetical protein [Candidatus Deferrimicrobium sp.]